MTVCSSRSSARAHWPPPWTWRGRSGQCLHKKGDQIHHVCWCLLNRNRNPHVTLYKLGLRRQCSRSFPDRHPCCESVGSLCRYWLAHSAHWCILVPCATVARWRTIFSEVQKVWVGPWAKTDPKLNKLTAPSCPEPDLDFHCFYLFLRLALLRRWRCFCLSSAQSKAVSKGSSDLWSGCIRLHAASEFLDCWVSWTLLESWWARYSDPPAATLHICAHMRSQMNPNGHVAGTWWMPIKLASVWSYVSSRRTASRASDAQRRDFAMSGSTRVAWKQRQTGEGTMHDVRCTMDVSTCLHSANCSAHCSIAYSEIFRAYCIFKVSIWFNHFSPLSHFSLHILFFICSLLPFHSGPALHPRICQVLDDLWRVGGARGALTRETDTDFMEGDTWTQTYSRLIYDCMIYYDIVWLSDINIYILIM